MPTAFPAEQSGMGGHTDGLSDNEFQHASAEWRLAAQSARMHAQYLTEIGVHKSVTNRLLEPFLWHTVLVTSTEWDGFWHQRISPMAQPEIRVAAEAMKAAFDASTPQVLDYGDWHTPLIQPDENAEFWLRMARSVEEGFFQVRGDLELRKRVSAARCARVSYLTHDGKRDVEADLGLFDKLTKREGEHKDDPVHWSPLEHVATPTPYVRAGNFRGWDQFRHDFEKETS